MVSMNTNDIRILRLAAVKNKTGLSRSTIYQYIKDGAFPAQFKLGVRCVGWSEQDIIQWIQHRTTV